MSAFKDYMQKSLEKEKEEIIKKTNKVKKEINESSFKTYLRKSKGLLLEEETQQTSDVSDTEEDEYMDNAGEENAESETPEEENTDDDNTDDYEKDDDEEAVTSSCPLPTRDATVNIENRQKAIDEFVYGPEDLTQPNNEFWEEKKTKFMVNTVELAKEKVCGNCAAFSLKANIIKCLDDGIDKEIDTEDKWEADAENRGYCEFLDFKCHKQRTCNSWVEGGPLTD